MLWLDGCLLNVLSQCTRPTVVCQGYIQLAGCHQSICKAIAEEAALVVGILIKSLRCNVMNMPVGAIKLRNC